MIRLCVTSRLRLTFTLHSFHIHVPCAPHTNLINQIGDTYLTDEETSLKEEKQVPRCVSKSS